jgi:hypothetical protein
VVAESVSGVDDPGDQIGMGRGVEPDGKERRRHSVPMQNVEDLRGVSRVRPVIEGERDLEALPTASREIAPVPAQLKLGLGAAGGVGRTLCLPPGEAAGAGPEPVQRARRPGPTDLGQHPSRHRPVRRPLRQRPRIDPEDPEAGRQQVPVDDAVGALHDAVQRTAGPGRAFQQQLDQRTDAGTAEPGRSQRLGTRGIDDHHLEVDTPPADTRSPHGRKPKRRPGGRSSM